MRVTITICIAALLASFPFALARKLPDSTALHIAGSVGDCTLKLK